MAAKKKKPAAVDPIARYESLATTNPSALSPEAKEAYGLVSVAQAALGILLDAGGDAKRRADVIADVRRGMIGYLGIEKTQPAERIHFFWALDVASQFVPADADASTKANTVRFVMRGFSHVRESSSDDKTIAAAVDAFAKGPLRGRAGKGTAPALHAAIKKCAAGYGLSFSGLEGALSDYRTKHARRAE